MYDCVEEEKEIQIIVLSQKMNTEESKMKLSHFNMVSHQRVTFVSLMKQQFVISHTVPQTAASRVCTLLTGTY